MHLIWNINGIRVTLTGATADNSTPRFIGYAERQAALQYMTFEWEAIPTPSGYTIQVRYRPSGFSLTVETSPTFNLGLEVASAIGRI